MDELEAFQLRVKQWAERALWLALMVLLLLVNAGREQTAGVIIHVLKLLAG